MGENTREFWNAKARTFPRFEEGDSNYEATMLGTVRKMGVSFSGKRVLDVGCGSGMYTIRIAREAAHVVGVDISEEMLGILEGDSQLYGVTNITAVRSAWEDFETEERFDIVFASMTPALQEDADREKLLRFARGWIVFMGYSKHNASDVMQGLYARYNISPPEVNMAQAMRDWLEKNQIAYQVELAPGTWVVPWQKDMLVDSCTTMLQRHGITPEREVIDKHLDLFRNDDGHYIERTDYTAEVIVWQHQ